ncbi:Pre-mRNA-splicing factor cwc26 [Sporothrix stenoceras]|uniref:Pre-mRNA-splicing factor cwc26 n=1 Tax=Sporothrix stenoceras TaxID=5173 RepID=A0ABR3ZJA2_9PEZI
MPADLTSYLAERYLVADTKPTTKKRKRKHNKDGGGGDGLLITDDDDSGWTKGGGNKDDDDDDEVIGAGGGYGAGGTIAGTSAEFRKTKKSNWTVLGNAGAETSSTSTPAPETDADAIIAAAAADTAAALAAEDEAPVVEAESGSSSKKPALMSDGTHAGLQSAASVTAQLERRRREEREQYERERKEKRERRRKRGEDEESGEEEVVYRDATGRRVDVALRRQEVRQAALEAEQKERDAKDALRGDVQREQARQRREELADAALMPLARGADDEEMNRELKAQARWNDPMAAFLSKETPITASSAGKTVSKAGSAKSSRPVYRGPAAPNRYGIRPGYRWDGVDRGIGFEAERFKAINRRERNKDLDYQWQMDV